MELRTFFSLLYPGFDENTHCVNVRPFYLYTQSPQYTKFCTTIDEICSHIKTVQAWNRHNIFFECPELHPGAKNGQEESCLQWPFLYADLDPHEKDSLGNIVNTFTKEELKGRIGAFPLRPSIVVDSGGGFHLYWLLEQPLNNKVLVKELLNNFSKLLASDKKATLLTQLLRPPKTMNLKKAPHREVNVVDYFPGRYSLNQIQEIIPAHKEPTPSLKLPKKTMAIASFQDLLIEIKQQNILSILPLEGVRLGQPFNCLFHNDNHPSATIYRNEETGFFFYKCFGCERYMDIIQVYSEKYNETFFHSVYALAKKFGINYRYSEWINFQYEKYHQNAIFIEEFNNYGYDKLYPELYKLLYLSRGKSCLHCLLLISHYAHAKLNTEEFQHKGESLFFFSYEYLAKKYGITVSTLKNRVTLLAILGFINKVPLEEIPKPVAQKALEQNKKKREKYQLKNCNPINFYTLPHFFNVMAEAESRLNYLNKHNYKIKTCNNKAFLLRIGWTSLAHSVFPDERTITKKSFQIAKHLEDTLMTLINEQGYATKNQIIAKTVLPKNIYAKETRKQRELGRFLSQILTTNNLQCIRAKKEHNEKFNLRSYPQIILPL